MGMLSQGNMREATDAEKEALAQKEEYQNAAFQEEIDKKARYQTALQQHAELLIPEAEGQLTIDNWKTWLKEHNPSVADKWIEEAENDDKTFQEKRKKLMEDAAEAEKRQHEALENSTFVDFDDPSYYNNIPEEDDESKEKQESKENKKSEQKGKNNTQNKDKKSGESKDKNKDGQQSDDQDSGSKSSENNDSGNNAQKGKDYTSAPKQKIEWINELYNQGIITDEQRVAGITLTLVHGYLESENDIMKKLTDPLSYEKMSAMRTLEGRKLERRMNRLKKDRIDLVSSITKQTDRYNHMLNDIVDEKQAKADKSVGKKSAATAEKIIESNKESTKAEKKAVKDLAKEKEPKVAKAVKTGAFAAVMTGLAAKAGNIREALEAKFKKDKTEEVTDERTLKAFIGTITVEKPFEKISEKAKGLFNAVRSKVSNVVDKFKQRSEEEKDEKSAEIDGPEIVTEEPVTKEPESAEVVEEVINNTETPVADEVLEQTVEDNYDYTSDEDNVEDEIKEPVDTPVHGSLEESEVRYITPANVEQWLNESEEKTIEIPVAGTSFVTEATVQNDGTFVSNPKTKKQEQIVVAKVEEQQKQEVVQQQEEEKKEEKTEDAIEHFEKRVTVAERIMERDKQVVKAVQNAKSVEEAEKIIEDAKITNNETVDKILDDKKDVEVNMKKAKGDEKSTDNETYSNINKIAADVKKESEESARLSREQALKEEKEKENSMLGKLQKAKDAYDESKGSDDHQIGD